MNRWAIRILICGAFAPALFADDASRLKKAEEYLQLTKADERSKQVMDLTWNAMMSGMEKQMGQTNLPPEMKQALEEFKSGAKQLMDKALSWESLKGEYAQMTADTFTETELDDILTFFKSSTGRSMAAKSEELMARGGKIGQKRAEALLPEIQKLSQEMVRKLQQTAPSAPRPLPQQ